MDLTPEEKQLLNTIQSLSKKLRDHSYQFYSRINPLQEDLFEWKEKGKYWTGFDNVTIYNSTTLVGDVQIGDNTWVGPFCSLDGTGGLKIGSYCSISAGVHILTHDTVRWALSGGAEKYEYAKTTIGNRCFIGTHAIIIKGVTVGDGCVIGAGAVVTQNVTSGSIVAGVPAKKIGITSLNLSCD